MTPDCIVSSRALGLLAAAVAAGAIGVASASASISGVCPDGSFFVVQRPDAIPCRDAKQVDPEDLPPLKPELLPRPHAWEVFNKKNDPNNPYNMIDASGAEDDGAAPEAAPAPGGAPPPQSTPPTRPNRAASARARAAPAMLRLAERDLRDLSMIVELSQQRAPATFAVAESGDPGLVLRLAQSAAFEPQVHRALSGRGATAPGPVVLFSAVATRPASFHANLTFVQDHHAFHPDPGDPTQLGLLQGRLGPLAAEDSVLGYVVLPERVDLSRPLDVYWNDRLINATLRP
jgi:hypothetical protein